MGKGATKLTMGIRFVELSRQSYEGCGEGWDRKEERGPSIVWGYSILVGVWVSGGLALTGWDIGELEEH